MPDSEYKKQPIPRQVVYDAIESHRKHQERQPHALPQKPLEAGDVIAQIAALCVQYMEQNGAPYKE